MGKRRRGGKNISERGQEWTLPAQLGQLKTVVVACFWFNGPLRQYFSLY